jgi:glutamyl-tRNA synthetase
METPTVRTRVAPSPTGFPHLGLVYQALFDYVFAKKYDGQFLLRIEDTDRTRFVEGAEEIINSSLEWAKLPPDESPQKGGVTGPYRQSERLETYQEYALELIKKGHAYRCFCTRERLDSMREEQQKNKQMMKYDRTCLNLSAEQIQKNIEDGRAHVIRMKIPDDEVISFHDGVVGEVSIKSEQLDDQVILKSDGFPTYHLAVVVDDYLMKITHIFRGTEWISSTPKHVLLYRFFEWEDVMPAFIHLPLLLNSDGKGKLSKRHSHTSVDYYRSEGYLPEAVVNYLANVVWNHPEGKEIFDVLEFGKAFELDPLKVDISSTGVRFDLEKLLWMNGEYIRAMSNEELTKRLHDYLVDHPSKERILELAPLVKERIKKLSDFIPLTFFLFEKPEYDLGVFEKLKVDNTLEVLKEILATFESLPRPWTKEEFEKQFQQKAIDLKLSNTQMFQLIRMALSGQTVTPPLFESIQFLGEEEMLSRLRGLIETYPNLSVDNY